MHQSLINVGLLGVASVFEGSGAHGNVTASRSVPSDLCTMAMAVSCHVSCRPSTCPPWLQAALSEIEQKIQSLSLALPPSPLNSATVDTFAERAENYYQKRPQLISLIQDLHNRYLHLADRYSQSLLKLNHHQSELTDDDDDDRPPLSSISTFSDADSSVSLFQTDSSFDPLVVELTMSLVEREFLLDAISQSEARKCDWIKKIELQRSLLEVMESERVVLVAENARLEYSAAAASGERNAAAMEVGYLRRRAGELAKCLAMMRDDHDHRVCLLGRRIEGLQKVVRAMERREREWREVVVRREREVREEMERMRKENRRLRLRKRRWWWVGEEKGKRVGEGGGWVWVNPCFCL